ncbi:MAG: SAM-dependent methyltransferase [Clostridia bacterium]|nr:SAM-dependent methyltransferase [Clostridia bacterium]
MMNNTLNKRLLCASSFVEKGAYVADVGCDHAYLPIYLIENNIASGVVAADINEGPCEKARENIKKHSLTNVIKVIKTDGLYGIEKYRPDNIVICGMGGDLIWKILSASEYTKCSSPLLILQPMTKQNVLRKELLENGYNIVDEELCTDDRLYEIIVARYDGIKREWNDAHLLCGKLNAEKKTPLFHEHIKKITDQYTTIIKGKSTAGIDTSYEERIIKELRDFLK